MTMKLVARTWEQVCVHTRVLNLVAAEIAFLALSHHQDGKKLPPAVLNLVPWWFV